MKLTRRALIGGAAGAALVGTGIYELVDQLTPAPKRALPAGPELPEQHILQDVRTVRSDGIAVLAPPLHHEVVTAKLRVGETPAALAEARDELEHRLAALGAKFPSTPAGLGLTLAWGLPYFHRYVPGQAARHLPLDRRATGVRGKRVHALEDSQRFPSDPATMILERNDVAILLRSDSLDHVQEAAKALFGDRNGLFELTSIRRGFAGGGFDGGQSLPKQMATAAQVPGADLIPDTAELFLGFTSTQKQTPGRARIANLETLGYVDLGPAGYFMHGTHMHLSHLFEDLEAWYLNFTYGERVDTAFRPGLDVKEGTQTLKQGPHDVQTAAQVAGNYRTDRQIGHSGSIQPASRLDRDILGPDAVLYEKGMSVPVRADFNTLDNPFFWSSDPTRDGYQDAAAAGLHFVVFNPTSDDFARGRLAMDGVLPGGRVLHFAPGSRGQGFNAVLTTTHRQNFLVPPRAHRALPLSELRA